MLNYYMHDGPAAFRFELAGDMDAADAARLEQDWRTASSVVEIGTLIIDLSFVTSIDAAGRELFRKWHAAGAQFVARSRRARELVELITKRPFTRDVPQAPTYRSWYSPKSLRRILPAITLLSLPILLTPAMSRAEDDGASLAFARFASRSAPGPAAVIKKHGARW